MRRFWVTAVFVLNMMMAASGECRNQRDFGFYGEGLFSDQEPEGWMVDDNSDCEWDWRSNDYKCDERCVREHYYYYESDQLCAGCLAGLLAEEDDSNYWSCPEHWRDWDGLPKEKKTLPGDEFADRRLLVPALPTLGQVNDGCISCQTPAVYAGYPCFLYRDGYSLLNKQLALVQAHPEFAIFWPENSSDAMNISNTAVALFEDLIHTTYLRQVPGSEYYEWRFFISSWVFDLRHSMHIALCAHCLHFSDYFLMCQELLAFSQRHFPTAAVAVIDQKLQAILAQLAPLFRSLYTGIDGWSQLDAAVAEVALIDDLQNQWSSLPDFPPVAYYKPYPCNVDEPGLWDRFKETNQKRCATTARP